MKKFLLIIVILSTFIIESNATTWYPEKHTCPVCSKKSTYQAIGSWGSYIYGWESKYEHIYWPLTESPSVYCCPKCHFSTYLWDFDSIPENKINTLKYYLKGVKLPKKYKNYMEIPMSTRLEIAENVYKILGRDDDFWCRFYRIMGYHYEDEQQISKAYVSRINAIDIANKMLSDSIYFGQEKEIHYIIACMYHKIGQVDTALSILTNADQLIFNDKNITEEKSKKFSTYLSELFLDFKEMSCYKDFKKYDFAYNHKNSNVEIGDEFENIYRRYSKEPFFEKNLFEFLKKDSILFSYHDIGSFLNINLGYTDYDNYELAEKIFLEGIKLSKNLKDTDIPVECVLLFDLTYLNYSHGYFEKAKENVKRMQKLTNPDGSDMDCLNLGYALEKEESDRFYEFINKSKD